MSLDLNVMLQICFKFIYNGYKKWYLYMIMFIVDAD